MLTVGFRFRAYGDVRAVETQLEIARELYNTLRWQTSSCTTYMESSFPGMSLGN